jgi:hypothetical protein
MKQKIAKGEFTFHEKYWHGVSDEAKSVVSHLLSANPAERVTAEKLLTHTWVSGNDVSSAALLSHENLREENQKQEHTAAMAHYKELVVKMRRPDAGQQKVNVASGIEELKARRKAAAAAKTGEKKKKSTLFSRHKASKAEAADKSKKEPESAKVTTTVSNATPTAGHKTRGGVAVGELVAAVTMAFCTRDESASSTIALKAKEAIEAMETDLHVIKQALAAGGFKGDGSAGVNPDLNVLHRQLGVLLIKDGKKPVKQASPSSASSSEAHSSSSTSELL